MATLKQAFADELQSRADDAPTEVGVGAIPFELLQVAQTCCCALEEEIQKAEKAIAEHLAD